ncbi:hypothetical protein GH714_028957 [Hevea brasiliensis]|uniref:Pentatricopeptide repeat-containing protein n=1 Tax=Hevea brasiliensis TaxID=3981 RepID=A0A6A6LEJ5_HEVBR|nr:hypothetical protein GH714_028957 [Hevea brasiliensis]
MGILLQACGHQKDIETGRKIHEIVSKSTQYSNDYVLNTRLITMYAACGSVLDSRLVFDNLQRKNLFQWNALVSGYTRNELYCEAINVFVELTSDTEFEPDNFTFPCVIKACAGLLDAGLGEVIHGMVIKMALVLDVFVGNALIAMYGKCGLVDEAVKVFDYMPVRNLVSWNSMIWLAPDVATMVTILPVCAREVELDLGMEIHGLAIKLGLSEEVKVNNALVDMYSKCGYLPEALMLFDKNNNKNVVSWNTMIGGFSTEGYIFESFNLLRKMQMQQEIGPNEITVLNILPSCLENSQLPSLKEIHGYSIRHEFQYDELVANALVTAYAKCGMLSSAERVFNRMEMKTVSSWNALIGGYAQNGDPKQALNFYIQMTYLGFEPDWFSIGSLLLACAHLNSLRCGQEVHGFALRNGLETDLFIGVSLLSLYIHCKKSSSARLLFDGMEDKSLVSWNAMISGYSQNGLPAEALTLFRKLLSNGIQPSDIAIMSVLGACSQLSALRLGKETHCYALKSTLTEDVFVSCSIIDMYAKSGCIEESRIVFDGLRDKDVGSWNAIIAAYGFHGYGKEAIKLFERMENIGQMPDCFTFIGILTACCHAGLVEEGLKYFSEMQNSHGLEPKLKHYACVIDMLGRARRLDDALRLVNEMPEQPDSGIWSSLLSSCRRFGALEMGEKVAEKLLELEPNKVENYVLLSNLYAGSGDNLLPESEEIRLKWRRLEKQLSKIGYKPNTGSVLHEVEEDEKIEILRGTVRS